MSLCNYSLVSIASFVYDDLCNYSSLNTLQVLFYDGGKYDDYFLKPSNYPLHFNLANYCTDFCIISNIFNVF